MIRSLRPGEQPPAGVEPRRYRNTQGYIRLRWKVGPNELVECYEHRWVMGNPPPEFHVHHINHVKDDNRPENLAVVTEAEHGVEHRVIDRQAARELYEAGHSTVAVGEMLGHDPAAIYRALRDDGVTMRGIGESLRLPEDDLSSDDIRFLHERGVRCLRIARLFGVSQSVVMHRVAEMGLPPHREGRPTDAERSAAESAIRELVG